MSPAPIAAAPLPPQLPGAAWLHAVANWRAYSLRGVTRRLRSTVPMRQRDRSFRLSFLTPFFQFGEGVKPVFSSVYGRGPCVVLVVLARERIEQALDAVVADFLGEDVEVSGGEARAADLDVVHLPSRGGFLHLVVDGNRLSPRLPDLGSDGDLRVIWPGAQRLELDHLVAVGGERAGIRAHEKRPEFPNELLALLGARASPVGAHRDPGRMREIEVGKDLRLDEARDLSRVAGLDVFVLADRGDHLQRNSLDERVRRQLLRGGSRRGEREHDRRRLESVMHGIQLLSIKPLAVSKVAPGLLTTLCQEHAFHVGCGGVFRRWPSHQRIGAPISAPGSSRIAARYSPPLRKLRMLMADLRSSLGSRELAHHFFRLRLGRRHRVLERLFAHGNAFDAHHVYVRHSDESEDRAKVGLLEIELLRGTF